jgi:hypothetical protein
LQADDFQTFITRPAEHAEGWKANAKSKKEFVIENDEPRAA